VLDVPGFTAADQPVQQFDYNGGPNQLRQLFDANGQPCVPFADAGQGPGPFSIVSVTGGNALHLRIWLEQQEASYVLATRCNDDVITTDARTGRADELIAALPGSAWRRLSVGAGAHGPREYDWARLPIRISWAPGRGHWLLARRSICDPSEIAYYICYGPRRTSLVDLAWIAGSRWRVEECFHQAKNEAGLDHYQVRTWRAWYAHISLSMLALAWLAGTKALAAKGESAPRTRT
jgi:hypothetical protein